MRDKRKTNEASTPAEEAAAVSAAASAAASKCRGGSARGNERECEEELNGGGLSPSSSVWALLSAVREEWC